MPDNTGFMIAGYAATILVLVGYVLSLVMRARAMARRADAIDTVAGR
jgi:CcmD family protein